MDGGDEGTGKRKSVSTFAGIVRVYGPPVLVRWERRVGETGGDEDLWHCGHRFILDVRIFLL